LVGVTAEHITSLARSDPPGGRQRWTLRMLAYTAVETQLVDAISHESVRRILSAN
jgi:hypothetical protein